MTTTNQTAEHTTAPQTPSSLAMMGTLGCIALVSGLLLALVYQGTYDIIERKNQARTANAVLTLLPGAVTQEAFSVAVPGPGGQVSTQKIYAGYDAAGALAGVALEASDRGGYGGEIRVLYGYMPDQEQVTGMTVLFSKETPGLGDRIKNDPKFLANFSGLNVPLDTATKKLKTPIAFVKPGSEKEPGQIEGISGATISSQAVARAMRNSTDALLPIVHEMLDQLKKDGR